MRRSWWIAGVISVGFHLLLAVSLLFMVRLHPVNPTLNPVGAVELLMVEKQGSGQPVAANQPPASQTPPPQPPAPQPKQLAAKTATTPPPPVPPPPVPPPPVITAPPAPPPPAPTPPPPEEAGEPMPPAATSNQSTEAAAQPKAEASPEQETAVTAPPKPEVPAPPKAEATTQPQPAAPEKLVFNLGGTDSESNAVALGSHVIPASPDNRFRNRPPVYPYDAALRGDHGAVVLVIHVNEDGASTGADVAETSGVASLDQAALDAVRKWHFRPALKDGQAVPFDMPMRFIFNIE